MSITQNEKEKKKKVAQQVEKEKVETAQDVSIYVGPTSKHLTRYASFTGGLPTHMSEHFEKCKVLKKMFIPTSDFLAFEKQLQDPASVENMLFNKVQAYFDEVNTL